MLSVLIECRNDEARLAQTLAVLVAGAVDGLISDVILLDHGSEDGTVRLADSAGCRLVTDHDLANVLTLARGRWLLMIEPGARPQSGWIEEIADYCGVAKGVATFSPSRLFKKPLLGRLLKSAPVLETGLLVSKDAARKNASEAKSLGGLVPGGAMHRMRTEIIPAWVLDRP